MASTRRIGSETSATRDAILKAAFEVLREKGAEGLSASSIGKQAGLKAHMIHYYFRSMDELIVELVRIQGKIGMRNTARAVASEDPLRALWELESGSNWGIAIMELAATAARRDLARSEMMRYIEEMRALQAEGVARYFALCGIEPPTAPVALTYALTAVARQIVRDKTYNVSAGHEEVIAAVEAFLTSLSQRGGADDC